VATINRRGQNSRNSHTNQAMKTATGTMGTASLQLSGGGICHQYRHEVVGAASLLWPSGRMSYKKVKQCS